MSVEESARFAGCWTEPPTPKQTDWRTSAKLAAIDADSAVTGGNVEDVIEANHVHRSTLALGLWIKSPARSLCWVDRAGKMPTPQEFQSI